MKTWLVLGAVALALAVAFGAFGAHGLAKRVGPEQLAVWKTATDYHTYAALGLLLMGVMLRLFPESSGFSYAAVLLVVGATLFSGSLYLLVLTGQRWLGPITPLGGLTMMAAWLYFAWVAWRL